MRVRSGVVCALLVFAAGEAAAAGTSSRPRGRGWVHWTDVANSLAARKLERGAAPRSSAAADARAMQSPAATPLSGAPHPTGTPVAWTGNGIPVCDVGLNQYDPTGVSDGFGGVIVAWIDNRRSHYDVYAMRLDGNGSKLWPAAGVVLSATDSTIVRPVALPDGAGGAFVILGQATEFALSDVIVQRVTAAGAVAPGWPANGRSTAPGGAQGYGAVPTNDGFLLMGWVDLAGQLRLVRLTGAGGLAPGWDAGGLAVGSAQSGGTFIAPAPDGAGGGYIFWDAGSGTVLLTRVAAGGGFPAGWTAAGTVVSTPTAIALGLAAVPIPGGDVMVFWPDFRNFTHYDIYAKRYTPAGALAAGWPASGAQILGEPIHEVAPDAVPDGAGGAVVVCQAGLPDSTVAQRVTGGGSISPGWPPEGVTLCREPSKTPSPIIPDGAGGALVAWSAIVDLEDDLFAQRVAGTGAIASGWPDDGRVVCDETGNQYDPLIVTDGAAGLIAVWEDGRGADQLIYAARVTSDGTVDALAALVSAAAEPGLVRLHWSGPGDVGFEAGLERARGEGSFVEIARLPSEAGHIRYQDRDVVAGETYRYRLAVAEGGATRYYGAVTVRVPDGARLSLVGFLPNPAVGAPRLAYSLPTAGRARIEVLDAAGRRVLEREVDPAPGEHVVAFDVALGPGVYLLRLTQGARSVTARAAIVR